MSDVCVHVTTSMYFCEQSGRNFDLKIILKTNIWSDGPVSEPLSINMIEQKYLQQIMNWLVVSTTHMSVSLNYAMFQDLAVSLAPNSPHSTYHAPSHSATAAYMM